MITRTTSMPYALSGMPQVRPFMEPVFIHRIAREEKPDTLNFAEEDKKREQKDPLPGFRKRVVNVMFSNSMINVAFFSISCFLFFFIGYQTRKSQESNSYVRLPTTN
ncbi:hypothetical protein NGRA_1868 [Nosema granulosis]|uniref:Uncharacterized protein n=1 Tax=Nosema granulosis TaxID=83296 RepID=A0A9P6H0Z2_9MICR|nr:hypothetical protein NGRA_1868 [Nosema granulosis]